MASKGRSESSPLPMRCCWSSVYIREEFEVKELRFDAIFAAII